MSEKKSQEEKLSLKGLVLCLAAPKLAGYDGIWEKPAFSHEEVQAVFDFVIPRVMDAETFEEIREVIKKKYGWEEEEKSSKKD